MPSSVPAHSVARAIHVQRPDTQAADASDAAVEHHEPDAIEAHQAAERGQPQIAVAGLEDVVDRVLREAVFDRPRVEALLRVCEGPTARKPISQTQRRSRPPQEMVMSAFLAVLCSRRRQTFGQPHADRCARSADQSGTGLAAAAHEDVGRKLSSVGGGSIADPRRATGRAPPKGSCRSL